MSVDALPPGIREKLEAPFPPEQTTTDSRGFTSIGWPYVMARLTDVLGNRWSSKVNSIAQHDAAWVVTAAILVNAGDSMEVSREGVGAANFGDSASDDVKAATSDAFKRAAVLYGVGAYLYRKTTDQPAAAQPPQQRMPGAPGAAAPQSPISATAPAQPFQIDAVKAYFKAFNMADDWVFTQVFKVQQWAQVLAQDAAAVLSGQHAVCVWLKTQYPGVTPPMATGGLKASNA